MATAEIHSGQPPAGMTGPPEDYLAHVLPFPSQSEKGFLDQGLAIASGALRLSRSIGLGTARAAYEVIGQKHLNSSALPKAVIVSDNGETRRFLVTEPDPGTVNPSEATNTVFHPGLTEMGDLGSSLRLHVAYAEAHPYQRVITKPTPGISHGKDFHVVTGGRDVEQLAADNLRFVRHLTSDGEIHLEGTSFGSYLAIKMAEQDLAADPADSLNITGLKLIASAVVATNVEISEDFREPDIDEDAYRQQLTQDFLSHVGQDLIKMSVSNSADMRACSPVVAAYALYPGRILSRLKTIMADFHAVQDGVEWSTLKQITQAYKIGVVGGSQDPLIQAQIPQWDTLAELYPGQVRQNILPGRGHLMTIDARNTVAAIDTLDFAEAS